MNGSLPSRKFSLPPVALSPRDGSSKVFSVSWAELPLVSLHLVLPRGAEADPPGKAGLADLAAEMLVLGTRRRSASSLAAELDGMGATLSAHAGWDVTALHIFGLSENFDRLMELLGEIYNQPAFSPEEFEQLKQRRVAALQQQKDESQILVEERYLDTLYQGTPYDHPVYGTLESIPRIECPEAEEFHRGHFLPEGSFWVVVGDVPVETCFREIENHFPSPGLEGRPAARDFLPVLLSAPRILLVDRPELTQSQIRLGHIAIPHAHPDYLAFETMNYVLGGGGFSSRLMQRIRSELGYTYGIRSSLEPRKHPGPFTVSTFTPTETTSRCLQEIKGVIRNFLVEGASSKEREEAINFFVGSYPMKFETPSQIAQRIIQAELHGLGWEYLSDLPRKISALSPEEMSEAARKHIHLERMLITIVGRAEKIRQDLESWGSVEKSQ